MSQSPQISVTLTGVDEALQAFDSVLEKLREIRREVSGAAKGGDPWSQYRATGGHTPGPSSNSRIPDLNPRQATPLHNFLKDSLMEAKIGKTSLKDFAKAGLLNEAKVDGMVAKLAGSKAVQSGVATLAKLATPLLVAGAAATAIAGVVIPVVQGAIALADKGSAINKGLSASYYIASGNAASAGQGASLAPYFGMEPGQLAGRAVSFGDALRGGGYGASKFRGLGINDQGFRTLDKMGNLIKALDALRTMEEKEAITVARATGIEDLLSVRDLSDSTYENLKNSSLKQTPWERMINSEYEAQKTTLGNNIDNIYRAAAVPVIGLAQLALDGLGFMLDPFGLFATMKDSYNKSHEGGEDEKSDPIKENTYATNELTRTIKDQAEMIGGGRRAKTAVPPGIRGQMFTDNQNSESMKLGAFTVG